MVDYSRFQPFDYGRSIAQGTSNALNTMRALSSMDEMKRQAAIRETGTLASQGGEYSHSGHADALRTQGYPMAAAQIEQTGLQHQRNQLEYRNEALAYLATRAQQVNDQGSWDSFRADMVDDGLAEPGELPADYDPSVVNRLSGRAEERLTGSDMVKVKGGDGNTYWLPAYMAAGREVGGDEGSGSGPFADGLKSSDENAIYRYAAGLYGGVFDPATGEMMGLDPDEAKKVQALSTRATELIGQGRAYSRHHAVSMAAREMNIDVSDIGAARATAAETDRQVQGRFPVEPSQAPDPLPAGQPGPTRDRARALGMDPNAAGDNQPRVIRFDEQGNRIE